MVTRTIAPTTTKTTTAPSLLGGSGTAQEEYSKNIMIEIHNITKTYPTGDGGYRQLKG